MPLGKKYAGRQKGTPNKRSSVVERLLDRMEADPIGLMVRIMKDEDADLNLRFKAAKELCEYVYPKRKAVEISGASGPVELLVVYEDSKK